MNEIKNEKFKLFMFLFYTFVYEAAVWGVWLALFVFLHIPGWSVIVAILMSAAQLQPKHFGLPYKTKKIKDTK